MVKDIVSQVAPKMERAIEHFSAELGGLRTGRATTAMLDGVMVESYGVLQPLKAVASISTPDGRSLAVTPWDKGAMAGIEKAIRDNQQLSLNPMNDGAVIRINIPALTEERRKEIVKSLGQKVEECRIALRNIRHEALNEVKRLEKTKEATTDDVKYVEHELSKSLEKFQKRIEELEGAKTREIMEV
jgi:ribosome recycling factor